MNLLLAFVSLTALGLWMRFDPAVQSGTGIADWQLHVKHFLWLGGWLNLVLFTLNLIPVPPLDGSRILAACSQTIRTWYSHPNAGMAGLIVFFLIMTTNLFNGALLILGAITQQYVDLIS